MKVIIIILSVLFTPLQDVYKVRLGTVIPADSPWEEGLNAYIDYVEKESGDRIRYKTYLGGQLGGEVEMVKSIAMGTLNAGAFSTAAIAEALNVPQLQVFELPFLFESDEEADYVMDKMFDVMSEILEKKGVMLVMWGTNGWRSLGIKDKAVSKPADLKGLKMRSQESDVYINFYKAIGATPVPIATPDVLVSLKTGLVDGFDQTPVFSMAVGWITTVKNFILTKHIYQPGAIVISRRFYNKLPENLRKIILAPKVRPALQENSRKVVRESDVEILASLEKDFGINVTVLTELQRDAFKKASLSVHSQMESKIGSNILRSVNNLIKEFRQARN
ncbi:TRAP transporter substrate-binding protein [Candidatus Amoebophilus asiaticus]|nr:TRAP transporter substrate-binding protein [Candidatus Amoebophilus asiaticus]